MSRPRDKQTADDEADASDQAGEHSQHRANPTFVERVLHKERHPKKQRKATYPGEQIDAKELFDTSSLGARWLGLNRRARRKAFRKRLDGR